jgi:hypothetical protein
MRAKVLLVSIALISALVTEGARAAAPAHFNPRVLPVAM